MKCERRECLDNKRERWAVGWTTSAVCGISKYTADTNGAGADGVGLAATTDFNVDARVDSVVVCVGFA